MLILITILMQSLLNYGWRTESLFLCCRGDGLAPKMWFRGLKAHFRLFTWMPLVLWRPWGANNDKFISVLLLKLDLGFVTFFLPPWSGEGVTIHRETTIDLFVRNCHRPNLINLYDHMTVLQVGIIWEQLNAYVMDHFCAHLYQIKVAFQIFQ